MKMKDYQLVRVAGSLWIIISIFLLYRACVILPMAYRFLDKQEVLQRVYLINIENTSFRYILYFTMIALAVLIGQIKGKKILSKLAQKQVNLLMQKNGQLSLKDLFTKRYLIILLCMMLLGKMLSFLQVPLDIRGSIDLAVGIALWIGGRYYYRISTQMKLKSINI